MSTDQHDTLEARVVRLEKQNRWMSVTIAVAGISVIFAFAMGNSRAAGLDTIQAKRFVLTDEKGDARAELSTLDGEYPKLSLRSPNGEKVTEVSPIGISVFDHGLPGKLPLAHYGNTGIYFTDPKGQVVIEIGGASTSSPQLSPIPEMIVFNGKHQQIWRAP